MVLIIIGIFIPAMAISGAFATALFLGIAATNREIRENEIQIQIENNIISKSLKIIYGFTFLSIGPILKSIIDPLIYNSDLRRYLIISSISGLIAFIIIKLTEHGA